ncbi:hypothetical protein DAPPUDRAFT_252549 [Daphnia pulex]|uniref:Uncharacterized protein n=1 Tax=Daphnia pulex TaxID=6669 RepID=E9H2Y4_DAPPU|nr:hypothetical protein DAPPUDRAFT_252549 [Daphnia pulex]|eukprot:EFX73868.1 hypothetical protein DAPPUDRAFT_252549 [Daphnia pulex]
MTSRICGLVHTTVTTTTAATTLVAAAESICSATTTAASIHSAATFVPLFFSVPTSFALVSDEVLRTVIAEVTSLFNSRPLTHVHSDPSDLEPLTPNHFLIGGPHPHRVPDDEQAFNGVTRRRWKQAQFIVNQFWRRWMREYLPRGSLSERLFGRFRHCQI